MFTSDFVRDALRLQQRGRFQTAFCLTLIAADAVARLRYGPIGVKERFLRFLNDELTERGLRMRLGVDLPPQPQIVAPPKFTVPADIDDLEALMTATREWQLRLARWQTEHEAAFATYEASIARVGEDESGWESQHIGKPRLVSTAGILYKARCDLVHEANLNAIRLVEGESLFVRGSDPIEFSSTWVVFVADIVAGCLTD